MNTRDRDAIAALVSRVEALRSGLASLAEAEARLLGLRQTIGGIVDVVTKLRADTDSRFQRLERGSLWVAIMVCAFWFSIGFVASFFFM